MSANYQARAEEEASMLLAKLAGDMPISALTTEVVRLREENQRLRNAIEIIEHTLATLRGEK